MNAEMAAKQIISDYNGIWRIATKEEYKQVAVAYLNLIEDVKRIGEKRSKECSEYHQTLHDVMKKDIDKLRIQIAEDHLAFKKILPALQHALFQSGDVPREIVTFCLDCIERTKR